MKHYTSKALNENMSVDMNCLIILFETSKRIFVELKCVYWVDAKVFADFLKNVFKRCSATMDAWFSCI